MKVTKKLAKHSLLLAVSLLVLFSIAAPAVVAEKNGSLEMKIDRIKEEQNNSPSNHETELDKVFPDLFADETATVIEKKETENNQSMEELQEELFAMKKEPGTQLHATRDSLFKENYSLTASATTTAEEPEATSEESDSGLGNTVLMALTGAGLLLSGGLYIMMQKTLG
ncbi:type VII secretion protein EssA [Sediminibacillus terrae]|uniref:type VII secretion protein EssA n=1 Tax=Sediminibacillus terrae TaxID=1562106 RepID=UPI00129675CE|nr:type VII secretion protein EssA [Sediminibacillus terrae]